MTPALREIQSLPPGLTNGEQWAGAEFWPHLACRLQVHGDLAYDFSHIREDTGTWALNPTDTEVTLTQ